MVLAYHAVRTRKGVYSREGFTLLVHPRSLYPDGVTDGGDVGTGVRPDVDGGGSGEDSTGKR